MIKNIKHKFTLPTYEHRSLRKRAPARYRMLTHENRALPDFMIIGTQKGGTTSLYKYLAKHPNIKSNYVVKELSFFDEYYSRGEIGTGQTSLKEKKGNYTSKELRITYTILLFLKELRKCYQMLRLLPYSEILLTELIQAISTK